MTRRPSTGRRRAGFTMLESLVVLAILALVAGIATQLLRPPSAKLRVEAGARALCATLRATRSRAIATNSEAAVVIDLDRKTYSSPIAGEGALPGDSAITLNFANSQRLGASRGAIAFFPDGSSTGGDVTLEGAGARATVAVNWLTGEASCAPG
jgi:general secretion pathway protein H